MWENHKIGSTTPRRRKSSPRWGGRPAGRLPCVRGLIGQATCCVTMRSASSAASGSATAPPMPTATPPSLHNVYRVDFGACECPDCRARRRGRGRRRLLQAPAGASGVPAHLPRPPAQPPARRPGRHPGQPTELAPGRQRRPAALRQGSTTCTPGDLCLGGRSPPAPALGLLLGCGRSTTWPLRRPVTWAPLPSGSAGRSRCRPNWRR